MTSSLRVRFRFVCYFACVLAGFSLCVPVPSYGQFAGATLSGTIADSSGSVIPNVKVTIKDVVTGIARGTTTDASGFYAAPNLAPSAYEITASAAGFNTQVRSGVTLTVGAQQVLNLTLQVGAVTQQVVVTSEAPTVQLESSALSSVVDSNTVRELPLNGRDWTQLATLQPGVTSMASLQPPSQTLAGEQRANRGYGAQLTISGGLPFQNNYRVDGVSVNDYLNSAPGNALGFTMGVDSIQEFSVVTSNYSAEYGRTSGGIINAITRSGGNTLHGTAYEFLRNSALDARNFFDAPTIPEFRRNQFGASAGAPIIKDKTFIFADYEGLRQLLGFTSLATVPSQDARNGLIHNANGTTTTVAVSPLVAPALALYNLPNDGILAPGNTGFYSFVAPQIATDNFVTARVDHHFSDKDSLFGTYLHEGSQLTLPDALNDVLTSQITSNQRLALEETHIFTTRLINTARFGFNRVNDTGGGGIEAINPATGNLALGSVPGYDAANLTISGITNFTGGLNNNQKGYFIWTSFQGYDDANYTVGKHSLKFGFDVERDQDFQHTLITIGGGFKYGSLSSFLTNGVPTNYSVDLTNPPVQRHYRVSLFAGYFEDDFRVRPNLTVNMGVRYDMMGNPTERDDEFSNLSNITDSTPRTNAPLFNTNPTLKNFEPRLGFAWDPFGNGKTSVRSGFAIFDVLPLPYEWSVKELNNFPFAYALSDSKLTAANAYPTAIANTVSANPTTFQQFSQVSYLQPNPPRNYVMQWNLSLQREVSPGLTIMASYIGTRGVHDLNLTYDANMVLPIADTPSGWLWPVSGGKVQNPNFGDIAYYAWTGNSFYNALEVQVQKHLNHGLQIQGSFTWSNNINQNDNAGVTNVSTNSLLTEYYFEDAFNRSLSDYNVKDNLVINATWLAPKPHFGIRPVDWTLGGWQVGGIFNARTGLPFTPLIGGDPLGTSDSQTIDFPDRSTSGPGCPTAVNPGNPNNYINLACFSLPIPTVSVPASKCVAFTAPTATGTCRNLQGNAQRNSLIGPGLVDFDFSLFKNNYFGHSERFNAQFRAEMFNILNRANFNSPTANNTLYDGTGAPVGGAGSITSTSTTSRQIQFAVKLIW